MVNRRRRKVPLRLSCRCCNCEIDVECPFLRSVIAETIVLPCVLQNGRTALMEAVLYGRIDAVQALLDAGADRLAEVRMSHMLMFVQQKHAQLCWYFLLP